MKASDSYKVRFTHKSLEELYYSRVGVRPTVGLDRVSGMQFERDLAENIGIILRKVEDESYRFTNYRQMLISKGKKELPRELCIPTIRDKLTLRALSLVIDDVYGDTAAQPMPQVVIDEVIRALEQGECNVFMKFDIKRFFASVNHASLMHILHRRIRKGQVRHLIWEAITTPSAMHGVKVRTRRPDGIPEGLSVSGKLANVYAGGIDSALRGVDGAKSWRYVDDILVLCSRSDAAGIESIVNGSASRLGLRLHSGKTVFGKPGEDVFEYLGYRFLPDGTVTVRPSSVRALEHTLESMVKMGVRHSESKQWIWRLNLRVTGCRITSDGESFERYGWLHYYSRINDIGLLCHLDWLLEVLFERFSVDRPPTLKSFKKAYYEIRYKAAKTSYVPTYGSTTTLAEKRRMLTAVFAESNVEEWDDATVERVFSDRIRREARRLERDVGLVS